MNDPDDEPCRCGHDVVDHDWMYPDWSMCRVDGCGCDEFADASLLPTRVGRRVHGPLVRPPAN